MVTDPSWAPEEEHGHRRQAGHHRRVVPGPADKPSRLDPRVPDGRGEEVGEGRIDRDRPVVLGAMWLLLTRTRWGALVRAATQDREMVGALGVDQAKLFTSVFFAGAVLAGLGGALQIPREPANLDRKSTRLNSSHRSLSRMPSSA